MCAGSQEAAAVGQEGGLYNSPFSGMLLCFLNWHTFLHNTNKHIAQILTAETI